MDRASLVWPCIALLVMGCGSKDPGENAEGKEGSPFSPTRDGKEGSPSTPAKHGKEGSPSTPAKDGKEGSPSTPAKDGKSVAELARLLESHDPLTRQKALASLEAFGPAAKEALPAIEKIIGDGNIETQRGITQVLAAMGPGVKEAIPLLIRQATVALPGVEGPVRQALLRYGKEGVPALIQALPNFAASAALGQLGPEAREAVPALIKVVEATREKPGVPEPGKANPGEQLVAAMALAKIGAKDAVPAITRLLQKVNPKFYEGALQQVQLAIAVVELAPKEPVVLQALQDRLTDRMPRVRIHAAYGLARAKPGDREAIGRLLGMLKTELDDPDLVIVSLGSLGPAAKEAFPALVNFYHSHGRELRYSYVIRAMLEVDAKAAVPILLPDLENPNLILTIVYSLGQAGPAAADALPALRQLAEKTPTSNINLRRSLARAIEQLEAKR